MRGLRINLYSPLREKAPLTKFSDITGIAHELNWHIEVIVPLTVLSENATLLEKSPVPVVIDHYGVSGSHDPAQPESRVLLKLLALPHVWIKLSAPYRVSANQLATRPDPPGWPLFWRSLPTAVFGAAIGRTHRRMISNSEVTCSEFIATFATKQWSTILWPPLARLN